MGRKSVKKANDHKGLTYKEMVTSAIENLKEKNGSTKNDIVKYIRVNNTIDDVSVNKVEIELKKGIEQGDIISCVKGKTRTRLFTINTRKDNDNNDTHVGKGKPLDGKRTTKANKEDTKEAKEGEPSTSDTLTRGKLPIKVKEAKEKKRAEAKAKRDAKPKKTKRGRKKKGNASKPGTSNKSKKSLYNKNGIHVKILAAFDEIWKNM